MPEFHRVATKLSFADPPYQNTKKLNEQATAQRNDDVEKSEENLERKIIEFLNTTESKSREVSESSTTSETSSPSERTPRFTPKEEEFLDHVWQSLKNEDRRPKKANDKSVPSKNVPPAKDAVDRRLSKQNIIDLMRMASKILLTEEALLEDSTILPSKIWPSQIKAPIVICGDLHGQYNDLLDIFDSLDWPPKQRYLFMGDYVDRGPQSVEVISLLLYLKVRHPNHVFLLRGNHETGEINATFGFRADCLRLYDITLWDSFQECFKTLSLAAVVSSRIICMHGGISPYLEKVQDIKRFVKPFDIPDRGIACDILWSDPYPVRFDTKRTRRGYFPNEIRKTSFWFCRDAVDYFLRENQLDLIVRGHEMMDDGYAFRFNKKLLTIFSAPQYCQANNDAAVLKVDNSLNCQVCAFIFKRPPPKMTLQQISSFIKIEPLGSKAAPVAPASSLSPSEPKTPSSAPSLAGPGNVKFTLYVPEDPANEVTLREKVTPMFSVPSNEVVEKLVRAKQQKKVTFIQDDTTTAAMETTKNIPVDENIVTTGETKTVTVEKITEDAKSVEKNHKDSALIRKVPDK